MHLKRFCAGRLACTQLSMGWGLRARRDTPAGGVGGAREKKKQQYDWCSLTTSHQAGTRKCDEEEDEPLAWPDYLEWHMSKDCPSWMSAGAA